MAIKFTFNPLTGNFDASPGALTNPSYTPATSAEWYPPAPTNMSQALDSLINHVFPRNVYPVFPNGPYATIQAAINQAVTDGYNNDITNPAFVLVYPKGGGSQFYVEDLTLKDGVSVVGAIQKGKGYTVSIQGKLTYTPQGAGGTASGIGLTVSNLYIKAIAGKSNLIINGANAGQVWLRNCYLDKFGDATSMVLMNGSNSSLLQTENLNGTIDATAAGCTIWDIQNGTLQSYTPLAIGSTNAGKILNCAANGIVLAEILSSCSGADAITIATGGNVTLSDSVITNNQANSNGANISNGGLLQSYNTTWNIPLGTGHCIAGVSGSLWMHSLNIFIANKTYSIAMDSGVTPFAIIPYAT